MPTPPREIRQRETALSLDAYLQISTSFLKSLSALSERSWRKSFLMATSLPRHSPLNTLPKQPPPIFSMYVNSSGKIYRSRATSPAKRVMRSVTNE